MMPARSKIKTTLQAIDWLLVTLPRMRVIIIGVSAQWYVTSVVDFPPTMFSMIRRCRGLKNDSIFLAKGINHVGFRCA